MRQCKKLAIQNGSFSNWRMRLMANDVSGGHCWWLRISSWISASDLEAASRIVAMNDHPFADPAREIGKVDVHVGEADDLITHQLFEQDCVGLRI